LAAAPGVTVSVALALDKPAAVTVTVAVPVVVAVKLDDATPLVGVRGDAGLNVPDTPLTENVIEFVALAIVLPLASWTTAV